jgi:hypothetical protein
MRLLGDLGEVQGRLEQLRSGLRALLGEHEPLETAARRSRLILKCPSECLRHGAPRPRKYPTDPCRGRPAGVCRLAHQGVLTG